MKFPITLLVVLALVAGGCSEGSSADSCTEFAAEVHEMIDRDASPEEIEEFIQHSDETVAKLVAGDPDRAEPCVTAVLEAMFVAEFANFEELLTE